MSKTCSSQIHVAEESRDSKTAEHRLEKHSKKQNARKRKRGEKDTHT